MLPEMTTGPTRAAPTLEGAAWLQLLESAGAAPAASLVRSALESAFERRNTLSARLAFGKLNQKVKPVPLTTPPEPSPLLEAAQGEYFLEDVVARVAFVVGLANGFPALEFHDILTTLYRTGSDREQIAILRALPFLPDQRALISLAREASRTNDVAVFSALACKSAFPARHLPDAAFGQLVLKALFLGVPLEHLDLSSARITPELQRMVADFAAERRAAGRPVPADVQRILEHRASEPAPEDQPR